MRQIQFPLPFTSEALEPFLRSQDEKKSQRLNLVSVILSELLRFESYEKHAAGQRKHAIRQIASLNTGPSMGRIRLAAAGARAFQHVLFGDKAERARLLCIASCCSQDLPRLVKVLNA